MRDPVADDDLDDLLRSWVRSMRARNLAPKTIRGYTEAVRQLIEHLHGDDSDKGCPTAL